MTKELEVVAGSTSTEVILTFAVLALNSVTSVVGGRFCDEKLVMLKFYSVDMQFIPFLIIMQ